MTGTETNGKTIDELFDEGVDMTAFIDEDSIEFPGLDETPRKFSMSMPEWMIAELDATAKHLAVSRQAVINMWVGERLEAERRAIA